jgi:hypothetical protein
VEATGEASASEVWQTEAVWGVTTANGLQPETTYTFAVKARNQEGVETAFGPSASLATLALPTGSCCYPDGSCAETTEADCSAAWTVGGTCVPNNCPPPSGSCCYSDGTCAVTLQADCTGTWTMLGVCTPNPCAPPTGSCCHPDQSCTVTTQMDCSDTWISSGTCGPNACLCPLKGDLTGDGVVDGLDIQAFVDCVFAGGTDCPCGDFDYNGVSDLADVPGFIGALLP